MKERGRRRKLILTSTSRRLNDARACSSPCASVDRFAYRRINPRGPQAEIAATLFLFGGKSKEEADPCIRSKVNEDSDDNFRAECHERLAQEFAQKHVEVVNAVFAFHGITAAIIER